MAAYYAMRGVRVEPERILLTASTSEAYAYLFKLLADPGEHVLVPRPSYPLFEFLAAMESIGVRQYPLAYHGGWSIDLDALEAAITPRTRAVALVNPNNPTGSFVKRSELAGWRAFARRAESPSCPTRFSRITLLRRTRNASPRWRASTSAWRSP